MAPPKAAARDPFSRLPSSRVLRSPAGPSEPRSLPAHRQAKGWLQPAAQAGKRLVVRVAPAGRGRRRTLAWPASCWLRINSHLCAGLSAPSHSLSLAGGAGGSAPRSPTSAESKSQPASQQLGPQLPSLPGVPEQPCACHSLPSPALRTEVVGGPSALRPPLSFLAQMCPRRRAGGGGGGCTKEPL